MAFSDYKNLAQVQQQFKIFYQEENFIKNQMIEPSTEFLEALSFNQENIDIYASEASRTEVIIFPILREIYKEYYHDYSLWIQKSISYDEFLTGTPDYLISKRSAFGKTVLEPPLVVVVEAKKNDFEQGWGQCLAELVAAQKLNKEVTSTIYGIVTDGKLWEFGKLTYDHFIKNQEGYTIDHLAQLFGVLHFVFQSALVHGKISPIG